MRRRRVQELLELRQDRRMLPIVFVAPVLQLVVLGYAATTDVKTMATDDCARARKEGARFRKVAQDADPLQDIERRDVQPLNLVIGYDPHARIGIPQLLPRLLDNVGRTATAR